eukprot:1395807-Rhodomonas_salina.1
MEAVLPFMDAARPCLAVAVPFEANALTTMAAQVPLEAASHGYRFVVLRGAFVLEAAYDPLSPYAMSGTDLAYAAIHLCACYAVSGTAIAYGAISLRGVRIRSPCYAMSGTELPYGAMRYLRILRQRMVPPGEGGAWRRRGVRLVGRAPYLPTPVLRDVRWVVEGRRPWHPRQGITLRASYAMSGTDI